MNTQLKEFFISKIKKAEDADIDWNNRKSWWLVQLDKLYDLIEEWLGDLKDQGVTIERIPKIIYEDYIGDYEAHTLMIKVGGERVTFDPVGTIIIAARGRVDIKGANGTAMLVLFPKGERPKSVVTIPIDSAIEEPQTEQIAVAEAREYEWCIVRHGGSRPVYIALNEKTFLEILRAVMGDEA
jgi:hypothetical protein